MWQLSFTGSWPACHLLPKDGLPEIAFAGRSNAGKSSLLNAVGNNKTLARVSRTPGRTRALNCFDVRMPNTVDATARLVDLPGYGFARLSKRQAGELSRLLSEYLGRRQQLALLVLIVDARRGIQDIDRQILAMVADCPVIIALSKCDKLSRQARALAQRNAANEPGWSFADVLATSASNRENTAALARSVQELLLATTSSQG